jgi:hypothetical protein
MEFLMQGTDAVHDCRRRVALLNLDTHNPSTPSLDCFTSDNLVGHPVSAFHKHVGLQLRNELLRRWLLKDNDRVNGG